MSADGGGSEFCITYWWGLLTKPLLNDFEHSILDLGVTVVVVGVMEGLKYLTNGKHGNTKNGLDPRYPVDSIVGVRVI